MGGAPLYASLTLPQGGRVTSLAGKKNNQSRPGPSSSWVTTESMCSLFGQVSPCLVLSVSRKIILFHSGVHLITIWLLHKDISSVLAIIAIKENILTSICCFCFISQFL